MSVSLEGRQNTYSEITTQKKNYLKIYLTCSLAFETFYNYIRIIKNITIYIKRPESTSNLSVAPAPSTAFPSVGDELT